ncbi:MAG: hypothetical protein ACREBG_16175 [Pyrinomonadaceae bacterium]
MFKRLLSLGLMAVLPGMATFRPTYCLTQDDRETAQAEKVRTTIIKHGIGKRARVEVKLKDNTRLKGYTSGIADDHFVVVNPKTSEVTTVPYSQVEQLKTKRPSPLVPLALLGGTIGGLMLFVVLSLRGS